MVRMAVVVVLVGFVLVGLPFVLVGGAFLRRGVRGLRERRAFRRVGRSAVASIQPQQVVKLVGVARPAGEALTGAFGSEPAVALDYDVAEWRQRSDSSGYEVVHEATETAPFRLEDADGDSVVVNASPDCLDASGRHLVEVEVGRGEEPPDRIREYVDHTEALAPAAEPLDIGHIEFGGERRRYRERSIRPGDSVLVFGRVVRDADAPWGDSLVVAPTALDDGLLTDRSEAELDERSRTSAALYLVVGAVLVVAPLVALAFVLVELGAG